MSVNVKVQNKGPQSCKFSELGNYQAFVLDPSDEVIRIKAGRTFVIRDNDGSYGTAHHNAFVIGGIAHGCMSVITPNTRVYPIEVEINARLMY